MNRIILASASPRRRELLGQIGLSFRVKVSDVEERITETIPGLVVEQLSAQKAEAVLLQEDADREAGDLENEAGEDADRELLVIGADTVVACDGAILGKPGDAAHAMAMLGMLQGRTHQVYTGVTLLYRERRSKEIIRKSFHEMTTVHFYPMDEREIAEYVASGDPLDKAGAYGIQGLCARYIKGIEGDYNNVVGLPVARLYQEIKTLQKAGERRKMKAVIFDLDGTLSDSINSIKYCGDKALEPLGYGPFTVDRYKYFVGDGAANLIKRALAAGGDTELEHFQEAFASYKEIFREHCMYQVKPYEGIPELLKALKERGIALAVLSNKPHVETIHVIETLFGRDCFDIIAGQKEDVPIKPSPEGVFRILEELQLTCEDIIYLGDTATDMKTGKAAGAFTVGALWGFRERKELEESHADAIIGHPLELLDYLS